MNYCLFIYCFIHVLLFKNYDKVCTYKFNLLKKISPLLMQFFNMSEDYETHDIINVNLK